MYTEERKLCRRVIAAMLAIFLAVTLLPATAAAEDTGYTGEQGNNTWITLQDYGGIDVSEDISTATDVEEYFHNTITKELDSKEIIRFEFKISGQSTQEAVESDIIANAMPHIAVYYKEDALTRENPVAAYEDGEGDLRLEAFRNPTGSPVSNIMLPAETLSPDTEYALVFDKNVAAKRSTSTIGRDVIFFFTTQPSETGLTLNTTSLSTSIGQSETLTAFFNNEPVEAIWTSSNEKVAAVDEKNGTVQALSEGTALITAKYGEDTISCMVKVQTTVYTAQGVGGNTFTMLQPSDITVLSENDECYVNRINTTFVADEQIVFMVKMSAGGNNFDESAFIEKNLPLIKVYDTYKGTIVAQSEPESGQVKLEYGGYDKQNGIRLTTKLERGSYCLVVGKDVVGNAPDKILGKDIVFQFQVIVPGEEPEIEDVALNWENVTLAKGAELTLKATVTPSNAKEKDLEWSSSAEDIASVDENGIVTAKSTGEATITVVPKKGSGSASCSITVIENELELSDTALDLASNQEVQLTAKFDGKRVTPEWQSDAPDIASIDEKGWVTAMASGHATLTAQWEGKQAICVVTVTSQGTYTYQGLDNTLYMKTPDNIYVKEVTDTQYINGINTAIDGSKDVQFEFDMTAGMNNFQESSFLEYSMPHIKIYNEDKSEVVAEYDGGQGKLQFQGIHYSDEQGPQGSYKATGLYIGVDAGVLKNGNYVLVFGKEVRGNSGGKLLGKDIEFAFHVEWSVEEMKITLPAEGQTLEDAVCARLDENHLIEDIKHLEVVTEDNHTMTEKDFAFIRKNLGNSLLSLNMRNAKLSGNQLPQEALKGCGALQELTLPETIVSLEKDSLRDCSALTVIRFTGKTPPSVPEPSMLDSTNLEKIIVPSGSEEAYKTAEPWNKFGSPYIEVESIKLNKQTMTLAKRKSETLTATITPESASNQDIEWSSSREQVATVDQNGKVTGLKEGMTTITVTTKDGSYTASCEVTVISTPPVITLNRQTAEIYTTGEDNTVQLTADVTESELFNNEDVLWYSSNEKVASVDRETGLVTGKTAGEVSIIARVGEEEEPCKVKVKEHTVSLDKSSVVLYSAGTGNTMSLRVKADGRAVSGTKVDWNSSNPSVVTVSNTGIIAGKKAGTATITASSNGKSAKCIVTVRSATIQLNKTKATIYTKKSRSVLLSATVNGKKAAGSAVSWRSSNNRIASVSKSGVVTAKRKGSVRITATANGRSATCKVTVKKPSLKLKKSSARIRKGKKARIRATATPKAKITYTSKNRKIATVTKKGVVRGKKKGKTTIRVKCNGVTKNFKVTVR